jgi:hypothetical protein
MVNSANSSNKYDSLIKIWNSLPSPYSEASLENNKERCGFGKKAVSIFKECFLIE